VYTRVPETNPDTDTPFFSFFLLVGRRHRIPHLLGKPTTSKAFQGLCGITPQLRYLLMYPPRSHHLRGLCFPFPLAAFCRLSACLHSPTTTLGPIIIELGALKRRKDVISNACSFANITWDCSFPDLPALRVCDQSCLRLHIVPQAALPELRAALPNLQCF
jgi:hypothetical protein